jgi:uncharacterized protein YndB with AHSA1/START domain
VVARATGPSVAPAAPISARFMHLLPKRPAEPLSHERYFVMGTMKTARPSHDAPRNKIKLQRTYQAPIQDVWNLWTTKSGIESWWGPEGFETKVLEIDPRRGGAFHYARTATGARQVEFMKQAGLPLTTEARGTFREIEPTRRLVLVQRMDFIPGVAPYEIAALVEVRRTHRGTRMVVTIDPAHDDEWTERSRLGWQSQLGRADTVMATREVQSARSAHARRALNGGSLNPWHTRP